MARPTDQALVASDEAATHLHPTGFDPSRSVLAISSSACFYPEEDDPAKFDGSTITWTFEVDEDAQTGAGVYELRFVRILTEAERAMSGGDVLNAIAIEARQRQDAQRLDPKDESAGRQASPDHSPVGQQEGSKA